MILLLQIARFVHSLEWGTKVIFLIVCDTKLGDDLKDYMENELGINEEFSFFAYEGPGAATLRCLETPTTN